MKKNNDIRASYMNSIIVISLIAIIVIGIVFVRIYDLYETNQSLVNQQALLTEQVQNAKIQSVDLANQLEYIETDSFVEEIAFEKFGMIKDGWKLIKSKNDEE